MRCQSEVVRITRARQKIIGRKLRSIFEDVVQEPVPDVFVELLNKIDARVSSRSEEHD